VGSLAKFGKTRITPYRKKASMLNPNNCLRYWDLADHIRIDDASRARATRAESPWPMITTMAVSPAATWTDPHCAA
jgi:hypothetical protein